MRTVEQQVFKFEELNDRAKGAAKDYLMADHFWGVDCLDSLKAFAAQFGAEVTAWEYGAFDVANIETDATPATFRGFTLKQARALPEWPTGYCLDVTLRDTFIKEFERTGDAFAAFNEAMDAGIKEARADWEAQYDDGYAADHCEANGYEFEADGTLYTGE